MDTVLQILKRYSSMMIAKCERHVANVDNFSGQLYSFGLYRSERAILQKQIGVLS